MSAHDKPASTDLVPIIAGASHDDVHDGEFETIERFQALEPGHYWTTQKDGGEYAPKGETLLLMDITEFEGQVHSVTLRIHPRHGSTPGMTSSCSTGAEPRGKSAVATGTPGSRLRRPGR